MNLKATDFVSIKMAASTMASSKRVGKMDSDTKKTIMVTLLKGNS